MHEHGVGDAGVDEEVEGEDAGVYGAVVGLLGQEVEGVAEDCYREAMETIHHHEAAQGKGFRLRSLPILPLGFLQTDALHV